MSIIDSLCMMTLELNCHKCYSKHQQYHINYINLIVTFQVHTYFIHLHVLFSVPFLVYITETYISPYQASIVEVFAVDYFCKKVPS